MVCGRQLDHIDAASFFKRMFGTKLYLGEPDARMYRERPELSYIQDASNITDSIFTPDYEIKEGDALTFGKTTKTFYIVSGHTDDCIARAMRKR